MADSNNNGGLFSNKGMDEQLKEIGLGGNSKGTKETYTYEAPKKPSRWKVIKVFLVFALIVGGFIGGVCYLILRPRVSVDSKKKLEVVLSPQYCERQFALKSNKNHLDFAADEPWTTGQIVDNLLKIKVEENNTGKERMNILSVKAKRATATIVLRQMPHIPYLNVSKDLTVDASGGKTTVDVSTDAFEIQLGGAPTWCKATVDDKQIVLDCENNTDNYVREGQIEIIADTVHAVINVKQAGLRGIKTEQETHDDFIQKHYVGDLKDGVPNGKGILNYPDGGTYDGLFVDGKHHGKGKYVWPNGDVYEGDWKNGKMSGKGIMKYADGDVYDGEWMNDKKNGKGNMKYADGNVYEGEWNNNARNGEGTLKYSDGSLYKGMWKDDCANGKGVLKQSDGSVYDGEWVNSKRQGKGKMKWATGEVYEGEWMGDEQNGKGISKNAKGKILYNGEWSNGVINGYGIFYYDDGSSYEGEFMDGKQNGKGKMKWANGDVYDGDWLNDEMNGKGKLRWAAGSVYEGEFKDGKQHGKGTYTDENGKTTPGVWRNGEFKFRW